MSRKGLACDKAVMKHTSMSKEEILFAQTQAQLLRYN